MSVGNVPAPGSDPKKSDENEGEKLLEHKDK